MIGVDLAKYVFQIHGSVAEGNCVVKRRLRRNQMLEFFVGLAPCLVGMDAGATARYWAREIRTFGHNVRLMPAHTSRLTVGACTATLSPLVAQIRDHVLAAERIHGDDTKVPVLATGKTIIGRYVRDDRPFGRATPGK